MVVRRAAVNAPDLVGDGQTGNSPPTVSHLEKFERIDEGVDLLLRRPRLEDERKYARGAQEIALPELVAGAGRERGMKHEFDFRAGREPLCDGERGSFDCGEAHGKSL